MTRSWLVLSAFVVIALASAGCGSDDGSSTTPTGVGGFGGATSLGGQPGVSGTGASGTGVSGSNAIGGASGRTAVAGTGAPVGPVTGGRGPDQPGSVVAGTGAPSAGAGGAATAGTAAAGSGGQAGTSTMNPGTPAPVCMSKAPKEFQLNTAIGGGGSNHKDSAHFALYGASTPDVVLNFMEAAHKCFIEDWCFRTPGLSAKADDGGPYYKTNLYSDAVSNAGGLTYWDMNAQLSYIHILASQINDPRTTVHEYGHAITMSEHNWIDQKRTGYWWETVANWVAYSFLMSPHCADARNGAGVKEATTIIDQMHTLQTVYNQSYSVICNDQNYYQAWPFLYYLTTNPDNYPGLGKLAVQDLMRKYKLNSNETPLHTLDRIAAPVKTQTILGRYWARMAYMDIGMPVGQKDFLSSRGTLTFAANWDSSGTGMYTVKSARKPQYGGANITPLKATGGEVSVVVKNLGNGQQDSNFTATLSIRAMDGAVRYVDLPQGMGKATVAANEEVSLVVVNTPDTLIQFDPQTIRSPENIGLNYSVQLTGATPAQ
jgi:hypothetical protein